MCWSLPDCMNGALDGVAACFVVARKGIENRTDQIIEHGR